MTASPVRTIRKRGTRVVGAPRTRAERSPDDAPRGAIAVFSSRIPHLWGAVAPLCEPPVPAPADPEEEAASLRAEVASRRSGSSSSSDAVGRRPGDELEALLAGWSHFDGERRAVLRAAVRYLARLNRQQRDAAREESLVDAAVAAVLRHNV